MPEKYSCVFKKDKTKKLVEVPHKLWKFLKISISYGYRSYIRPALSRLPSNI